MAEFRRLTARVRQLQARDHEMQHRRPVLEAQVTRQRSYIFAEGGSPCEGLADQTVSRISELRDRVKEKRQQVHRQQQVRQMLLP